MLQKRTSIKDIKALLGDVTIVSSQKSFVELYQKYGRLPRYVYLRCHARHVITVMHECWNIHNVQKWRKRLKKKTIIHI